MTGRQIAASGGQGGALIDKNAKFSRSDEPTGGFRREIFPNTVASAGVHLQTHRPRLGHD